MKKNFLTLALSFAITTGMAYDPSYLIKDLETIPETKTTKQNTYSKPDTKPSTPTQSAVRPKLNTDPNDKNIYVKVETKAEYIGGKPALGMFLRNNLNYPKEALSNGVQGTVVIEFTVEKDGSTSDIKVVRSVEESLDREAVRVVKLMKDWIPAMNADNSVRSKFRLPVAFKLE